MKSGIIFFVFLCISIQIHYLQTVLQQHCSKFLNAYDCVDLYCFYAGPDATNSCMDVCTIIYVRKRYAKPINAHSARHYE